MPIAWKHEQTHARLDAHEDLYAEYFARQGRGWVANEQAISDRLACSGWFATLTNDASLTCAEIDRLYSDEDRIEKAFGNVKERLDCRTTRVSSEETLGEITAKQRNIFEKLKVDLPALSQ